MKKNGTCVHSNRSFVVTKSVVKKCDLTPMMHMHDITFNVNFLDKPILKFILCNKGCELATISVIFSYFLKKKKKRTNKFYLLFIELGLNDFQDYDIYPNMFFNGYVMQKIVKT